MSFLLFNLLFAAVAAALLVVIVLAVRQLRRQRQSRPPLPGWKPARAAPDPAPPPARKRRLRTLSELEEQERRQAAPATGAATPDETPVPADLLARLEACFDRLEAGEITLQAYRAQVLGEQAQIEQRLAALADEAPAGEREAAQQALQSVRWCLDWADQQQAAHPC
jgi:hypothetical protein